jgi:hypothetical protein
MDAQKILESHGLLDHIDLLEPLRQHLADVVLADASGVLIKVANGGAWILTLFEQKQANRFVDLIGHDKSPVCCHGVAAIPLLEEKGFRKDLSCFQAAYLREELFDEEPGVSFRTLTLLDEPMVLHHYHLAPPSYIHERILSGTLEGVLLAGNLAGFMGCHSEGALGMLEIFPYARRKGLAFSLEKHYCNTLLRQGKKPYCHIVKGNEASTSLHQKLGFSFSQSDITWFD